jgi:uncharacterized tellurite resistance protein B-like protein
MAVVTTYVIESTPPENPRFPEITTWPVIYRVITVDDVVASKEQPKFEEVVAAQPALIEEYFNTLTQYYTEFASFLDQQTAFTVDTHHKVVYARRLLNYVLDNFNVASQDEWESDLARG